jgi:hypothetical protein
MVVCLGLALLAAVAPGMTRFAGVWMGRQPDGSFLVSTGQRIEAGSIAFTGRPIDLALHPTKDLFAILNEDLERETDLVARNNRWNASPGRPDLKVYNGGIKHVLYILPCDHSRGVDPKYPTPRAMMADNDLALGRVVEAVTASPQWKETCIFVIEDDAQSGPDHVDGHRTAFMVISPYNKRKYVDSTFYAQTSMVRSIEMILGLDPMNRFDALADPITTCFTDALDLTPYRAVPSNIPLDERNPAGTAMNRDDRFWLEKTRELDWSHIDAPDPYWLNRIIWYSIHKGASPYPGRPGEQPGQAVDLD